MPDIKSALNAALLRAPVNNVLNQTIKAWDDEGESAPKGTFMPAKKSLPIRNNVMRETFNYILNHPGLTAKIISHHMENMGFKPSSVTSVVSQLKRTGQVVKQGDEYVAVASAYIPMGAARKANNKGIKDIPRQGLKDLSQEPPKTKQQDPLEIVKHMNVYQARELYDHLRCMFGS